MAHLAGHHCKLHESTGDVLEQRRQIDLLLIVAAERGAPLYSVEREFGSDLSRYPTTNLEGDYQRWNAATAALVARLMPERWRLTPEVVARGLGDVSWPGRWQVCR